MKKLLIFSFFVLLLIPLITADDEYKPYLHKPIVPENPGVKLYGSYQTNLFPGAATYSYNIEDLKGTNGLQPSLSISYNSQTIKQRPSILGAGWSITQNYIYRNVNFTLFNTTDDTFVLVLNNANHDLVYDEYFHTESETFSKIVNVTDGSNAYWNITLKDGTKLRFGYNSDSELHSNTGQDYSLKWFIDQIEDVHGNKIYYTYRKDPYTEDQGAVYISEISYNNDQKRKITIDYEAICRPDRRLIYEQGNKFEESRRLSDINIFFNNSLVRRYDFEYSNLNDEKSISSIKSISYYGSDNVSSLHSVNFSYYKSESNYYSNSSYNIPEHFANANEEQGDLGVRLTDFNNDGYVDLIKSIYNYKRIYINNKTDWDRIFIFDFPEDIVDTQDKDYGIRFADVNNDGFTDMLKGYGGVRKGYINNQTYRWIWEILWTPPVDFIVGYSETMIDNGVRLVDFNGDGRIDIIRARNGYSDGFYLNTGKTWKDVSSEWDLPVFFVTESGGDAGSRLVDLNGDGLIDIIKGSDTSTPCFKCAWLHNGSGWTNVSEWVPSIYFTSNDKADYGYRFADINGDGLVDMYEDYSNQSSTSSTAWINNGSGWVYSEEFRSPEPFTKNGKNIGRRIADVNGDGFPDILYAFEKGEYINKSVLIRNQTLPYLLKNITNEFGGVTSVKYAPSTSFNNTGSDGHSDIGFNVWVVSNVTTNDGLNDVFFTEGLTGYSYYGGFYDYNESEFRGFSIVNETLWDNSTVSHHFIQDDQLKGKEYKTIAYNPLGDILTLSENKYNFTSREYGGFISYLKHSSNYLYDGTDNPLITNISYEYDQYSNVIEKINHGNAEIEHDERYEKYEYKPNESSWILGKVSKYSLYDYDDSTLLKQTEYTYDSYGDLIKSEEYNSEGSNPITKFTYDSYGNLIENLDPLGRITKYEYGIRDPTYTYVDRVTNDLGHAVDYVYDAGTGNLLSETKNGISKTYIYDVFGRIIKEILPYDSSNFPTKKYTYTFDGISPESIKISQKTTSNKTLDTYYFYDGFGNLVQIKTPGSSGNQVVKNIYYDGLFRVKEEDNPYFDTSTSTLSSPSSQPSTTYQYDSLSRITKVTNPDSTFKSTNYNQNVIKDYDENGNYKTYYLDAFDRIIAVEEHNTDFYIGDNETYNTTYSYNGKDELVGIRDHYGNEFNFTYDSLGRKIQLDDPDLGTWTYYYDVAGNLIRQTDNAGNIIYLSYDELNRLKQKNTTSVNYTLSYDEQFQGTLSSIEFVDFTFSYDYDRRLRVIKETITEDSDVYETGMTYDSSDRIIEKRLPSGQDLDFYYNAQGKLDEIRGFINSTQYNAFGNPLSRIYFNEKVTEFAYDSLNARLRQIKTDSVQDLNYSYDPFGNVVEIEDSANNRLYAMSYDKLDRLTNVSIDEYKWIYNYDPIGNILKIIRNFSTTTQFKYDGAVPHFPSNINEYDTGVDIYRQDSQNNSDKTKIVEFYLVNEKNKSIYNASWTADFGDGAVVNSTELFNLSKDEEALVVLEHTYDSGGDYKINLTGKANNSVSDYDSVQVMFGATALSMRITNQHIDNIAVEFVAKNTINQAFTNWRWWCDNGNASASEFDMAALERKVINISNVYTPIQTSLTCTINSSEGNQSITLPLIYDGIKVENYNTSYSDADSVLVQFRIRNYFTQQDVNWNITSDGRFYEAGPITVGENSSTLVSQQINYTNGGTKEIIIQISGEHNFSDSSTEYYDIDWLNFEGFYNYVKSATARVFSFLINNDNLENTSINWDMDDPVLEETDHINTSGSMLVVIEENYGQGDKAPIIKVYNQTQYERQLIDVFKIREIEIKDFYTAHEEEKRAVTTAMMMNNINPVNLNWSLNNTETRINSNQTLELNTSQSAFVVIESNFSEKGIYPVNFLIHSNELNDNATGVVIS